MITGVQTCLWTFHPVPLIYFSVFVPVSYCLNYFSFAAWSEVRESDSSSFIFLFQDCFDYLGPFVFYTNCCIFFFSSVKDAIVLNLKMAFDSMGILFNINSLNPLTWDIFPFICVFFGIFHQHVLVCNVLMFQSLS